MKYLGIDYGRRKIGLSISEGQLASVFKVLTVGGVADAVSKIIQVIHKEDINRVIVGVPEGGTGKMVKSFVENLKNELSETDVVVLEADETLSSKKALDLMIQVGASKKDRKKEDAFSAAIILQNFLDSLE